MKTLNDIITISTATETETGGDATVTWSTPVSVRAKVTQVDGSRYIKDEELTDSMVYRIELYDNSYSNNIRIVYNSLTLYPIRPITKNQGGSLLNEIIIIASAKG